MQRVTLLVAFFCSLSCSAFLPRNRLPSPRSTRRWQSTATSSDIRLLRGGATASIATTSQLGASLAMADISRDAACAAFGLVGATVWLKLWTVLAAKGAVDPKLSRKIVHSGSAPLFMLTWPFFSGTAHARFVAALVPAAFMCRLLLARYGKQPELVKAISRSGDDSEATGGPFLYVLVLIALTLGAWRDSLISVVAVSQMALGDGFADIIGRRFGKAGKWPACFGMRVHSKSFAGSAAFFVSGFLGSLGLVAWFNHFGCLSLPGFSSQAGNLLHWAPYSGSLTAKLFLISLVVSAVELVPIGDDNLTVPAASIILTTTFLGGNRSAGFLMATMLMATNFFISMRHNED